MLQSLYLARRKALLALGIGACLSFIGFLWSPNSHWPASLLLAFALAWASLVDIERLILPDPITLGLVISGLVFAWATWPESLLDHAIGAAAGYLSLVLVATGYRRVRRIEGIGRGDAKLFAAGGAWLGWQALPNVLLIASASGLIFALLLWISKPMSRSESIAFGPFIAIGIWLRWFVGSDN